MKALSRIGLPRPEQTDQRHWIPACAGMTKSLVSAVMVAASLMIANGVAAQDVLIRNATVHTASARGTLQNAECCPQRRHRRGRSACPGQCASDRRTGPAADAGAVRRHHRDRTGGGFAGRRHHRQLAGPGRQQQGHGGAAGVRCDPGLQPGLGAGAGGARRRHRLHPARRQCHRRRFDHRRPGCDRASGRQRRSAGSARAVPATRQQRRRIDRQFARRAVDAARSVDRRSARPHSAQRRHGPAHARGPQRAGALPRWRRPRVSGHRAADIRQLLRWSQRPACARHRRRAEACARAAMRRPRCRFVDPPATACRLRSDGRAGKPRAPGGQASAGFTQAASRTTRAAIGSVPVSRSPMDCRGRTDWRD